MIEKKRTLWRRLWPFLRPYGARLAILAVLLVVNNLLTLCIPMLSGWAVGAVGSEPGAVDFGAVGRNCARDAGMLRRGIRAELPGLFPADPSGPVRVL